MSEEPQLVIVGKVRKAQGIRGEILVESLSDTPEQTFASGRRLVAGTAAGDPMQRPKGLGGDGMMEVVVSKSRPFKGGFLLALEGISDRTEAEKWRGRYLLAPASELQPPRENEVYLHELLGLAVETAGREEVGKVTGYYELPQGLMIEIRSERGDSLLPYRPEVVAHVDLQRRVLTLHDGVDFTF